MIICLFSSPCSLYQPGALVDIDGMTTTMMMTTTMITVLLGAVRLDGAREQKTMTMTTDPHRDDAPLDVITMKMTTIAMIQRHEGDRYVVVAANPPPGPRLILIKDIAEAQGIRHDNS